MMTKETCVLIIDDDETMLDSCSQVFIKEGYQAETANNGDDGLAIYQEKNPDLVLVDLKMPKKDGLQVLAELIELDPNCVAIVITGYGTIQSAVEAMKHGAFDFLPKPFTPDELRFIVRRGLERRRYILETETLRNEKIRMRENFVSMVSHELRSPLAAVQQNLMVITGGMAGSISDEAHKLLSRMSKRIKGLNGLINDWLDLSRIESGEMIVSMEAVDLKAVMDDTLETLRPLAEEKQVGLNLTMPESLPMIQGNHDTLQMLITNLAHNSIKYNKENGSVEINICEVGSQIKIEINDSGIGIPEEKLPLIFEQFYRTKDKNHVSGSGLGLSIVKKIIEAHQGSIDVESETGVGTRFTVLLPVTQSRDE